MSLLLRSGATRLGKPGAVIAAAVARGRAIGVHGVVAVALAAGGPADEDDASLYAALWEEAATDIGATASHRGEFTKIARNGRSTLVWRQETDLDGSASLHLAADKEAVHELLVASGIAVPDHAGFVAGSDDQAAEVLRRHGRCAVKPANGTARGRGVTTAVRDIRSMHRASLVAARWSRRLLIEEEVRGDIYRLLYLDGELLDSVVRHRPVVVGDGHSSVLSLVTSENERRLRDERQVGTVPLSVDLDMALTVAAQGVRLTEVVSPGRRLVVKGVVNENSAPDNERRRPPEAVVELGRAAAAAVGIRLAGVDAIVTDDDSRPCVILEVNGTPGLLLHSRAVGPPLEKAPAASVLERLLAHR